MSTTAIVILAAGDSSRLGRSKQLLAHKDTTLLGHTIKQLTHLPKTQLFVVLGAFQNEIKKEVELENTRIIENTEWKMGMGRSLSIAMEKIQKGPFDQVLVTLCDLPKLESNFYQSLLNFHISNNNEITRTAYPEVKGVPVIFDHNYFPELRQLTSDEGAKVILQKHKNRVTDFSWSEPYFDVDTMEAYRELQKRSSGI